VRCGNCDGQLVEQEAHGQRVPGCPVCGQVWGDAKTLALVRRHRRPPPGGTVLSLVYEPNGTDHDDLVLRIGRQAHRSDSYYYGLDHAPGEQPDVAGSLLKLLDGWALAVQACGEGQTTYLPHAFFDQCSGWLCCTRLGDSFEVVDGWSEVEGWAFYPSDFADKAGSMNDFLPMDESAPPIVLAKTKLLADIEASKSALKRLREDDGGRA
jgi:Zn-finger nucleic acid-binding protein